MMGSDGRTSEWPLVAFTIGVQVACGIQLVATAMDLLGSAALAGAARVYGVAVFPVALAAVVCSMLHLGRPLAAWKSLLHVSRSRLSREVWITGLFVAAAFVSSGLWYSQVSAGRTAWGFITAGLGVGSVGLGAAVYVIPARPVWNSAWVPLAFASSVLLAAGSALPALAARDAAVLRGAMAAASACGGVLQVASAWWMLVVARRIAEAQARATGLALPRVLEREPDRWSFVAQIVLAGVLPTALAVWLSTGVGGPRTSAGAWVSVLALGAPVAGAALGRRLMFGLGTRFPRF